MRTVAGTGIIETEVPAAGCAGDAGHGFPAGSAEKTAGKRIVSILCPPADGLAIREKSLNLMKQIISNNHRDRIFDKVVLCQECAGISNISENGSERVFVPSGSVRCGDPAGIQITSNLCIHFAGSHTGEDLADDLSLRFINLIMAVGGAIITIRDGSWSDQFPGIIFASAADFLRQFSGIILGQAFQDGFHEDAGRIIRDRLSGRDDADAVLLQLVLIDGRIIPITGEPVEGIDKNNREVTGGRVLDHALELRPLISAAGDGAIRINPKNSQTVPRSIRATGMLLLFDGCFTLGGGTEPGINDGGRHMDLLN